MAMQNGKSNRQLQLFLAFLFAALAFSTLTANTTRAEKPADLATISGIVWFDLNHDGVRDQGEPLMSNHPVYLQRIGDDLPGAMVARVETDEAGVFTFPNLEHGSYRIYLKDGASLDLNISQERSVIAVELFFTGHQLFLPLLNR
jgi:hypothetical protein